jgi:D-alanyl-D-alanine carboxypeptidase/D-alanyl-D-alanine-endopeptidase (penicillin-binding protein 4)
MIVFRLASTLLLASSIIAAPAADLTREVTDLIQTSPAVQRGSLGFKFVDVQSGEVLAELNSAKFFIPASNTKLYTTALALVRLGPDYKFQTQLRTSGAWTPGQATVSDLQVVGGGDPNLSGRVLPYAVHSVDADPLGPMNELASKLAAAGLRQIDGDVIGVATRYAGDLYPDGWTIDDSIYSYGAPVSALALNDNSVSVIVTPSANGELAEVALQPATEHLVILNQVVTDLTDRTDIHLAKPGSSSELVLWGSIGTAASSWRQDVAVDNPALFASEALIDALREQHITVRGVARSQYSEPGEIPTQSGPSSGTVLAVHDSVPLSQELQLINKVSQNLHAEMLLREVAHIARGVGTLDAGRAEREEFLEQIRITHDGTGFALDDGSGLARQDLTTPESTVALLRYMWQRPERDVWVQSLPIGGVDGSLEHRFGGVIGAERVHAKTGSISHVNTLGGYIETNRQRWVAFSVMVNATTGPDSDVRTFMDHLCALFLNE